MHKLILGDASVFDQINSNSMPNLIWVFYVFVTFVLVIVMLNLLISIIGDTYDKVKGMEKAGSYLRIFIY